MTGILMTLVCRHVWTARTHISLANITSSSPQTSPVSVTVPLHIQTRLGIVSFCLSVRTHFTGVPREQPSKKKRGALSEKRGDLGFTVRVRGEFETKEHDVETKAAGEKRGCAETKVGRKTKVGKMSPLSPVDND